MTLFSRTDFSCTPLELSTPFVSLQHCSAFLFPACIADKSGTTHLILKIFWLWSQVKLNVWGFYSLMRRNSLFHCSGRPSNMWCIWILAKRKEAKYFLLHGTTNFLGHKKKVWEHSVTLFFMLILVNETILAAMQPHSRFWREYQARLLWKTRERR